MINKNTRAYEVCQYVGERIKLKCFLDFRLYLVDERLNYRVMDDDELIYKAIISEENIKSDNNNNNKMNSSKLG
jgi:hypothetical protein